MGTPQMRWRLMHQSGRVAIMLVMRSLPQAGSQTTLSISSMASCRKVVSWLSADFDRCFKRDEPLLGGAKDDRMVAAPAMRIGVLKLRAAQQRAALFQHGDDDRIRLPHVSGRRKAGGCARVPGIRIDVDVPAGIDAASGVEPVALAGIEVVGAVRGRGVDRAGAGVGGDVGGQHAEDAALEKRMLEGGALEPRALEAGELFTSRILSLQAAAIHVAQPTAAATM